MAPSGILTINKKELNIMRGKRAKALRKLAATYVTTIMKKSLGDGYNVYNRAMNSKGWDSQLDDKGLPMKDPDGVLLMKVVNKPGTITSDWKWRNLYRILKKRWTIRQR